MADRLLAFGLGTHHTILFFVPILLLLHLNDNLGALLVLGTWTGILVFLAFWGITVFFTERALRSLEQGDPALPSAAFWGGAEGLTVVALAGLVSLVAAAAAGGAGALLFGVIFLLIAAMAGVIIGAVIGLLFGALAAILLPPRQSAARSPQPSNSPPL